MPLKETGSGDVKPSLARLFSFWKYHSSRQDFFTICLPGRLDYSISKEYLDMEPNSPKVVFEETRRHVAGIDVASRGDLYVCGPRNSNNNFDVATFGTITSELYRMMTWLKERQVVSVAMESTSVYWIPIKDLLELHGIEVLLVDSRMVRMIPGRKSDMKDCQWLQKLHSCELLHGAFRPPQNITAIRTILREKDNLVAMRTQSIQQMQKSLDQMNIRIHHAVSDIDGKTGTAIVQAIVDGERDPAKLAALRDRRCKKSEQEIAEYLTGTWRDEHLFNLEQAFKTMLFIAERIVQYDSKVAEMYATLANSLDKSENQPPSSPPSHDLKPTAKERANAVEKFNISQLLGVDLTSIPGLGYFSVAKFISELGTSLECFESVKRFFSYLGLAPALNNSAGKHIPRQNRCKNSSRAGHTLRMAAASLARSNCPLGIYFRNIAARTDKKTAIKATARRIAQMIYGAIKYGKDYLERGLVGNETRLREKALKTVNKLIKSHNINSLELNLET
jgi:transposase